MELSLIKACCRECSIDDLNSVREKFARLKLSEYFSTFVSKLADYENRKTAKQVGPTSTSTSSNSTEIYYEFYSFVRTLESFLDQTQLNETFMSENGKSKIIEPFLNLTRDKLDNTSSVQTGDTEGIVALR